MLASETQGLHIFPLAGIHEDPTVLQPISISTTVPAEGTDLQELSINSSKSVTPLGLTFPDLCCAVANFRQSGSCNQTFLSMSSLLSTEQ